MLQRDAQFPLENKGSLKATWNIPLGWPPSKNLFAAQNNPPRGGEGKGGWKRGVNHLYRITTRLELTEGPGEGLDSRRIIREE